MNKFSTFLLVCFLAGSALSHPVAPQEKKMADKLEPPKSQSQLLEEVVHDGARRKNYDQYLDKRDQSLQVSPNAGGPVYVAEGQVVKRETGKQEPVKENEGENYNQDLVRELDLPTPAEETGHAATDALQDYFKSIGLVHQTVTSGAGYTRKRRQAHDPAVQEEQAKELAQATPAEETGHAATDALQDYFKSIGLVHQTVTSGAGYTRKRRHVHDPAMLAMLDETYASQPAEEVAPVKAPEVEVDPLQAYLDSQGVVPQAVSEGASYGGR